MCLYIGLMSGTSVDAIDVALVEFSTSNKVVVHATHSHPWPLPLREAFLSMSQQTRGQSPLHEVATLDVQAGELFAQATLTLLEKSQIPRTKIKAIGSPGQTLYHYPDGHPPYTWQLGDPNVIAQLTGIPTVADFRRRDMAAGGQGAPLTPAFHAAMWRNTLENRIVLNIGGIANITVLPANPQLPVIGFDTGPGNALLDAHAFQHLQTRLDENGNWAASGQVQSALLTSLLTDPYFTRLAPKSTGRDYFNLTWLNQHLVFLSSPPSPVDIQATLGQLTIDSIAQAVRNSSRNSSNLTVLSDLSGLTNRNSSNLSGLTKGNSSNLTGLSDLSGLIGMLPYTPQRLLVCGGGVHNPLLMAGLAKSLPEYVVESIQSYGIDPDWVEAVSFAWFAKQRLEHQTSNLPSVTGAKQAVVLGAIYL